MIASEFVYDNIVLGLNLNFPVFLGPVGKEGSYHTILDVNSVSNPKYLRDTYIIKFYAYVEQFEYSNGLTDMYDMRDEILGHENITDGSGNIWCRFLLSQGPTFIGVDDLGRSMFTMEYEVTVDSLTGTHRDPIT